MPVVAVHGEDLQAFAFPEGLDVRWETQTRSVWNTEEQRSEEVEFVYKISLIEELGAWRRFLVSQRKLRS